MHSPMRWVGFGWLVLLAAMASSGCGSYVAHRMAQAPNRYPSWLAPQARVFLACEGDYLGRFPARALEAGPPPARLHYRVVPPADYRMERSATHRVQRGKSVFRLSIRAEVPGTTNAWSARPRGTAVLLHGYALAEFALLPWALELAQQGWQCVLVDLRGHGQSTGRQVSYGVWEMRDLSQLLDTLGREGMLSAPVAVVGESYGAALALRWKTLEPRVGPVVAIAPYAVLSNAVMNICRDYAPWLPRPLLRAGMKRLPRVLRVDPAELDPLTALTRHPPRALIVAASEDKVTPTAEMDRLLAALAPGSRRIVIEGATHETLPYHFSEVLPPLLDWLKAGASDEQEHGFGIEEEKGSRIGSGPRSKGRRSSQSGTQIPALPTCGGEGMATGDRFVDSRAAHPL